MKSILHFLCFALACALHAEGLVRYADPVNGKADNPGTAEAPWPGLSEVAASGKLATLSGGGTVFLRSGSHGKVRISGDNAAMVTLAAAPDAKPELVQLTVPAGSNWTFRGLAISPSFSADPPYAGAIVTIGEKGPTHDVIIEDSFIFTALDASEWTKENWMQANGGIVLGRNGKALTARNNFVLNTRFGISITSEDSLCEGNVVTDFSADGIRVTRDNVTIAWNVVKNIYVSMSEGDKNHDDAIQCFPTKPGSGMSVRNAHIHHNLLLMRENPKQPFPANFQGIGFFDGPLLDFRVEDNVVTTEHYHGISLYDAQNGRILNNSVFNPWDSQKYKLWVMLGSKPKIAQVHDNIVRGNRAHSFSLKADATVQASDNEVVNPEEHWKRFRALLDEISKKFGRTHPVAGRERLDPAFQPPPSAP